MVGSGTEPVTKPINKTVLGNQAKEYSLSGQAESAVPDIRNNYIYLSAWWSGILQGSHPQHETSQSQVSFQL